MSAAGLTEVVHRFGDGGLFGIVTLPPERLRAASEARPFAVLLNSGLVHRVGPFRAGVELARSLAARGVRVLRYDRSGLGDSRPASLAPIEQRVVEDGRAALDSLAERYGAGRFVVGGLCAGALNAHRVAVADPRIVGAWLLDGYAWPTASAYRERLARRLRGRDVRALAGWLYGRAEARLRRLRGTASAGVADGAGGAAADGVGAATADTGDGEPARTLVGGWPPREMVRRDLEAMLRRGVRFLFHYTGGWSSFVAPRQFDEMFPGLPNRHQITVVFAPRADHTFLALDQRTAMLHAVGDFVSHLPR